MTTHNAGTPATIQIAPTKGRPMLQWVGKRPLGALVAHPAQHTETFDPTGNLTQPPSDPELWQEWPAQYPKGGLIFYGDNKEVLTHLIANGFRGKVNLIYIDPPFNTGVDYVRKVTLRGIQTEKIEGESLSFAEQTQYLANWQEDVFFQFLYERLQLAKELLSADGVIFIRLDVHFGHYLKVIADEVFGADLFQNEIIVNRIKKNVTNKGKRTIPHAVDSLYVYYRSNEAEYNDVLKKLPETSPGYWHSMESQGISGPRQVIINETTYYPSPGTHFKFTQDQADAMIAKGRIRANKSSKPEYWVEEKDYQNLDSDWTDISGYSFTTGYPTENSEVLLERVIRAGSRTGDLVLDFFAGSGTTAAVAQKLGRRWVVADINKGAIQTTSRRVQAIIRDQMFKMPLSRGSDVIRPAQLAFTIQRVNNYDLTIQHNELVELVVQKMGIVRTPSDVFFDGTLGDKLVKIAPVDHPLSPLDLETVKHELEARPEEMRSITVVCLDKQDDVEGWLTNQNKIMAVTRLSPTQQPVSMVNKIEVVDLRNDPVYGGIIAHHPAQARVTFRRDADMISVQIEDFISPTIIQRLKLDETLFQTRITDWRAMVNSVEIDPAYNGTVLNIGESDIPEKKDDLVKGAYTIAALATPTTVAVKITDMLGEEVLVTETL